MSGLEIIGIAASIIQIADVGVNVSVKLCTFVHQVKNVNQSVQSLSNDVALTSSVLRHLGENLQQDEQAQLCSTQALVLAQSVLGECEKLFAQINAAIEQPAPNDVKSRLLRSVRKVGLALSERELDALRNNLDRLKSTMLLMLNVIMYAGQLRSRKDSVALQDQRSLVQALAEKQTSDGQFGQVLCALPSTQQNAAFSMAAVDSGSRTLAEPAVPENLPEDLQTYFLLIKRLLGEVDLCQSKLQPKRYISIRNGLLRVHTDEQVDLELQYGQDTCQVLHRALFGDEGTGGEPMSVSSCIMSSAQENIDDRDSPGLQPSKSGYIHRGQFFAVENNTALDQASTGEKPDHKYPAAMAESNSINYLAPLRPDIAEYERLDPRLTTYSSSSADIVHSDLQLWFQSHQSPLPPLQYDSASEKPPEEPQPEPLPEHNPLLQPISETTGPQTGSYRCHHSGCTAPPFQTQYLLNSHTQSHSRGRPYFCPVEGCRRGVGGKGFRRKNEMIRHGLVHNRGYNCPFCSDQSHKYPRPANLQRHVRIHHVDVGQDHPLLRQVLTQRPEGERPRRRRGVERADEADVSVEACRDIVDSLLLAWTTLSSDEVSVPAAYVQE